MMMRPAKLELCCLALSIFGQLSRSSSVTRNAMHANWIAPEWWRPSGAEHLPLLRTMRLHTIMFVTDRRPSAAVALAAHYHPLARVLVLTPSAQRQRVLELGATWADLYEHANRTAPFSAGFRQGSPGARRYHLFCHVRWMAVAAALRERPPPLEGMVAVLDDDVLLFERLDDRLREAAAFHPAAHAETVVSGAFVLASAGVLARLAAFLWALYALPANALAAVAWQYGESKPLSSLSERDRTRIDAVFRRREGQFSRFSDMDAIEAFRLLSRTSVLPLELRVHWTAGHRRASCIHAPKLEKIGIFIPRSAMQNASSTRTREPHLRWHNRVPHLEPDNKPLCFLHLQGPQAKHALLSPMLADAGFLHKE